MSTPPFKVKAVFEYTSPHEDDLHFPNGQIITVTEDDEADWFTGEYVDSEGNLKEGIFPRNFVEKYEPTAPPRPTRTTRPKKEEPAPVAVVSAPIPEPAPKAELPQEPKVEQKSEPVAPREIQSPPESQPAAPAAVTQVVPKAAPTTSKSPPPPVTEKPTGGSFRDRIAAFNKPAAAPVTPFKPSGLGSGGSAGFIRKPFVAPPPSKDAFVPPPREAAPQKIYKREEDPEIAATAAETQDLAEKAGFSPTSNEDGEDQPKPTSLKERIALLQKQQAEQAARHAEAAQKKEKPKRPVKKRTESHDVVEGHDGGEGAALERQESQDTVGKQSIESTREEPAARAPMPRRKSSRGPPVIPGAIPRESFGDGNEADMSGAGDETEEPEDMSTGRDDSDEKPRLRAPPPPARAPAAPRHEPDVGEEEGASEEEVETIAAEDEEEEEEEEEEEIDPEVRRKEELRARMAKMSGGMGMHGMFGPPGGMPMPGPSLPPKKKSSGTSDKKQVDVDTPIARAPPVPMPGMSRVTSAEEETRPGPITGSRDPEDVADIEDIEPVRSSTDRSGKRASHDGFAAPPVPGSRPAPPPVPADSRPQLPPLATPMSPSAGSESDDELSLKASNLSLQTPTASVPPRPAAAPAVPSRAPELPGSPRSPPTKRASYFGAGEPNPTSPTTPGANNKRASRVPPIPGSIPSTPAAAPAQTRAPPPPPPSQPSLSRSSTGDARVLPSPEHAEPEEESEEEITEYEGDYDTDIASAAPHKDALKAHARDSSLEDATSVKSPISSPSGAPPPLPPMTAPRGVPPPLPSQPPPNARQSVDTPRAAPPPPPPAKEPVYEDDDDDDDDEYDPYKYTGSRSGVPIPGVTRTLTQRTEEDIYSASPPRSQPPPPQERAAPPPPPRDPMLPPPMNRNTSKQSMDVQRTQSSVRRSTELGRMSMDHGFMAMDIDLGESTEWWTKPNGVPPVFQNRTDILHETEESTSSKRGGKTTITKDLYVLFPDYSQTIVTVRFDSQAVSDASFEQRHEQPPSRLRQDQLEQSHERFGSKLISAVSAKKDTVVGDGTTQGLIHELLKPFTDALLPVGTRAYGALVYANMANASVTQNDEIRPGDIISVRNGKFQGKHGSMHTKYTAEVGSGVGHVGIVAEWDGTKKKLRAWEQGRESKKVRLESFKLDDLRSGEVKIWRVMPRSWVGWEGSN